MAALFFTAGCDGFNPLFDEVNLDPHPPVITSLVTSPAEIFAGEEIFGILTYSDTGGDIEELAGLDLNSNIAISSEGPAGGNADEAPPLFFPGTSGEVRWRLKLDTKQAGLHRVKMWLIDSKDSRSEPAYFEVTVKF